MSDPAKGMRAEIRTYTTGFALALVLTGIAFALVRFQAFSAGTTLALVLLLALVQVVVHFRCFLHIGFGKGTRDQLQLILFSGVILLLMAGGTLVLLFNLARRMM